MEIIDFTKALSAILNIEKPWVLTKANLQRKNKVLDIFISIESGSKFACVQSEKVSTVYDTSERRIRHLDLFDCQCYLNIIVPRTNCTKHGVLSIGSTKLFRQGSHYSYLFEDKIMRLCVYLIYATNARFF